MATKRGRPPKPKAENPTPAPKERKFGSGRVREPLSQHPQRYAVAALDAAAMMGFKGREGAKALLALAIGKPHETRPDVMTVETSLQAFNREADRWRKLGERYVSPADLEWRQAMSQAILLAATVGHAAEPGIRSRATAAGEFGWVNRHLLPLMSQRLSVEENRKIYARIFSEIFLSQLAGDICCDIRK